MYSTLEICEKCDKANDCKLRKAKRAEECPKFAGDPHYVSPEVEHKSAFVYLVLAGATEIGKTYARSSGARNSMKRLHFAGEHPPTNKVLLAWDDVADWYPNDWRFYSDQPPVESKKPETVDAYSEIKNNRIRTRICNLMSAMLDNPDKSGIYPTSEFMSKMEDFCFELRHEAIGWTWAEACCQLDKNEDPHMYETSQLLDRVVQDLDMIEATDDDELTGTCADADLELTTAGKVLEGRWFVCTKSELEVKFGPCRCMCTDANGDTQAYPTEANRIIAIPAMTPVRLLRDPVWLDPGQKKEQEPAIRRLGAELGELKAKEWFRFIDPESNNINEECCLISADRVHTHGQYFSVSIGFNTCGYDRKVRRIPNPVEAGRKAQEELQAWQKQADEGYGRSPRFQRDQELIKQRDKLVEALRELQSGPNSRTHANYVLAAAGIEEEVK